MLVNEQKEWTLPNTYFQPKHIAITEHINDYFCQTYNLETQVLRCAFVSNHYRAYEVEVLNGGDHKMFKRFEDVKQNLNNEELKLLSRISINNSTYPSWFKLGWRKSFEKRALSFTGTNTNHVNFEQIRSWEKSALHKVSTDNNAYYIKTVPQVFGHEPLIAQYLYHHHGGVVPSVESIDHNYNEYIMQEVNGELLGYMKEKGYWKDALSNLATIQKHSIDHLNELKNIGCPSYEVSSTLEEYLERCLKDLKASQVISEHTYEKLSVTQLEAKKLCQQLTSTQVPPALEHGDFFGGNIMVQDGKSIIYDWSDCTISHPFLSMTVIFDEIKETFSVNVANDLLKHYLGHWTRFGCIDELKKEFMLVKKVATLYYLTIYQQFIVPHFIDNWDQEQIINSYVKQWLSQFDLYKRR
ncbi:phosphotransferase [Alkalibacillus haloalkaliphilus]|uniref:phosphotransferase n=1 Tax=Alkalibacillus haloalkaliphilus TaxID=94136 RepID=UPI002935E264|nr:phosphotransferase [Alkalibacillus haloalkaliphilus]MDV2582049.1 phosphotransferase [Alkalibacillus haloalkaliphilus]